jgi:hypothetical protein
MNFAREVVMMGAARRNELQGVIETFGADACSYALENKEDGPMTIGRLLLYEAGFPSFNLDFHLSDMEVEALGQDLIDAGIYLAGESSLHVTKT